MRGIKADLIEAIERHSENRCGIVYPNNQFGDLCAAVLEFADWSREVQSAYDKLAHRVDTLSKTVDQLSERDDDLFNKANSLSQKVDDLAKKVSSLSQKVGELSTKANNLSQKDKGQPKNKQKPIAKKK